MPQPVVSPAGAFPATRRASQLIAAGVNLRTNRVRRLAAFKLLLLLLGVSCLSLHAPAQDRDGDGLTDAFEATLLQQFAPRLMISSQDCAGQPSLFRPQDATPTPIRDDGTIYAQAFPRRVNAWQRSSTEIELHFYHLWHADCGRMGHALDTEHISVLLRGSGNNVKDWHAIYWYAAAHEDTVCDASQVSRASTLRSQDHGATVWISQGKHASFLDEELCRRGCGGDRCTNPRRMQITRLVNLGEFGAPMNGAIWISSPRWPLAEKMERSDFAADRIGRLDHLPTTDIAWANPALRPEQGAISGGNAAIDGTLIGTGATTNAIALGNRRTDTALSLAGSHMDSAAATTRRSTGNALGETYRSVRKALGDAARETGNALDGEHGSTSNTSPQ